MHLNLLFTHIFLICDPKVQMSKVLKNQNQNNALCRIFKITVQASFTLMNPLICAFYVASFYSIAWGFLLYFCTKIGLNIYFTKNMYLLWLRITLTSAF